MMNKRLFGIAAIAVCASTTAAACASTTPAPRPADLAAWRNVPVLELETHPHFAIMSKDIHKLSDGSELWDYANCDSRVEDAQCRAAASSVGASTFVNTSCHGPYRVQRCCHNVFRVSEGRVISYDVESLDTNCFTTCEHRPRSKPCSRSD